MYIEKSILMRTSIILLRKPRRGDTRVCLFVSLSSSYGLITRSYEATWLAGSNPGDSASGKNSRGKQCGVTAEIPWYWRGRRSAWGANENPFTFCGNERKRSMRYERSRIIAIGFSLLPKSVWCNELDHPLKFFATFTFSNLLIRFLPFICKSMIHFIRILLDTQRSY